MSVSVEISFNENPIGSQASPGKIRKRRLRKEIKESRKKSQTLTIIAMKDIVTSRLEEGCKGFETGRNQEEENYYKIVKRAEQARQICEVWLSGRKKSWDQRPWSCCFTYATQMDAKKTEDEN